MDFTYAVIGAGSIGRRHHDNLTALGRKTRLIPYRQFDLAEFKQELAANRGRMGVVIATGTNVRLELILLCAEYEAPVYIEKPAVYRPDQLEDIYNLAPEFQQRSVIGFMMRYHPAIAFLLVHKPDRMFRTQIVIGHDVTQWRQNWRFSDSYASKREGGGVLLDLCHEIDLACLVAPDLSIERAICLDHPAFPGVDIATQVSAHSQKFGLFSISLDYLAPKLVRDGRLEGMSQKVHYCLAENTVDVWDGEGVKQHRFDLDRNRMFWELMSDFITLAEQGGKALHPLCPRMDWVKSSCLAISQAWQARRFVGQVEVELS